MADENLIDPAKHTPESLAALLGVTVEEAAEEIAIAKGEDLDDVDDEDDDLDAPWNQPIE